VERKGYAFGDEVSGSFCIAALPTLQGLGQGILIIYCGWPAVASEQRDMVVCVEVGSQVLNHTRAVGADGHGDIPPGWCVSVL
jgi:hypothetical protein